MTSMIRKLTRQEKKQLMFNHQMDQYNMYQLGNAICIEMNNYLKHNFPQYATKYQIIPTITSCSLEIHTARDRYDNDFTNFCHIHREDVYYIQRHYQHTISECNKRLKKFIETFEEGK